MLGGVVSNRIRLLGEGEAIPLALLLLADPSEEEVMRYAGAARIFVCERDGGIVGACALSGVGQSVCEIKNIAVAGPFQGMGIGALLLRHVIAFARDAGFARVQIATGNSSIGQLYLYQKVGFEMQEIDRDYFVRTYPDAIFENGIRCRHRVLLAMEFEGE